MLYVELQKALYGLLQAALLFYEKLLADLQEYGLRLIHMIHAWKIRLSTEANDIYLAGR